MSAKKNARAKAATLTVTPLPPDAKRTPAAKQRTTPPPRALSREEAERAELAHLRHLDDIISAIRAGAHVPKDRLAYLVRAERPLPRDVRWYLADWIEGRIKHKGRPKPLPPVSVEPGHAAWFGHAARAAWGAEVRREGLAMEYRTERESLRTLKKRQPSEYAALCERLGRDPDGRETPGALAFAVLAERHRVSYDSIRHDVKRAPKN